jgi:cytochrome bd-type quinol oxidase subunit 2
MATATMRSGVAVDNPALRWGSWLVALAGVGAIGYAVIFFILNFTDQFLELGIGPEQVDVRRQEIQAFSPSLFEYVSHLHLAVAGFLAALGLAVIFLAVYGIRQGHMWAWVAAVASPVLGLAVALPAHYPNGFDTLGHLGLVYLDAVILVAGALLAYRGLQSARQG